MTGSVLRGIARYLKRISGRTLRMRGKAAWILWCLLLLAGFFLLNWIYQVVRKPGDLLAPFSSSFSKAPESTWHTYGTLFEAHSTEILSPEFLAALAQVESDGNPLASPGWRWRWSWNPFNIYRPASTALGMFQFTDATFAEARKYCIRDHKVVAAGHWYDLHSCWFNNFYTRNVPSHAIEMTAAYLHHRVVDLLDDRPEAKISLAQRQRLAAVIHLCGMSRGERFANRGFRAGIKERCGSHSLPRYLAKIDRLKNRFARLRSDPPR